MIAAHCVQVIEPVRSRCLCIRVAAPSYPQIEEMLAYVAKKEGLQLPAPLSQRIAQISDRNLRRALLCFETCKMSQYPFSNDQAVQITDWELYIQVRRCCYVTRGCLCCSAMWQRQKTTRAKSVTCYNA